jgi:hypothetical protein
MSHRIDNITAPTVSATDIGEAPSSIMLALIAVAAVTGGCFFPNNHAQSSGTLEAAKVVILTSRRQRRKLVVSKWDGKAKHERLHSGFVATARISIFEKSKNKIWGRQGFGRRRIRQKLNFFRPTHRCMNTYLSLKSRSEPFERSMLQCTLVVAVTSDTDSGNFGFDSKQ